MLSLTLLMLVAQSAGTCSCMWGSSARSPSCKMHFFWRWWQPLVLNILIKLTNSNLFSFNHSRYCFCSWQTLKLTNIFKHCCCLRSFSQFYWRSHITTAAVSKTFSKLSSCSWERVRSDLYAVSVITNRNVYIVLYPRFPFHTHIYMFRWIHVCGIICKLYTCLCIYYANLSPFLAFAALSEVNLKVCACVCVLFTWVCAYDVHATIPLSCLVSSKACYHFRDHQLFADAYCSLSHTCEQS